LSLVSHLDLGDGNLGPGLGVPPVADRRNDALRRRISTMSDWSEWVGSCCSRVDKTRISKKIGQ
jgi:hypothetical protein